MQTVKLRKIVQYYCKIISNLGLNRSSSDDSNRYPNPNPSLCICIFTVCYSTFYQSPENTEVQVCLLFSDDWRAVNRDSDSDCLLYYVCSVVLYQPRMLTRQADCVKANTIKPSQDQGLR